VGDLDAVPLAKITRARDATARGLLLVVIGSQLISPLK
jgi:hypothetical protein